MVQAPFPLVCCATNEALYHFVHGEVVELTGLEPVTFRTCPPNSWPMKDLNPQPPQCE